MASRLYPEDALDSKLVAVDISDRMTAACFLDPLGMSAGSIYCAACTA